MEELKLLYHTDHHHGNDLITLASPISQSVIDDFLKQLYDGELKNGQLHTELYLETANKLTDALMEGIGRSYSYDDPENQFFQWVRYNMYNFSAAKGFTEQEVFKEKMFDENGKLKSFSRFRADVKEINKLFNENYLHTEYNLVIASTQNGIKWIDLNRNGVQYLEYRTMGDDRVRPEHEALNGKVAAIDDPIWNTIYPPNDYGCRCTVLPALTAGTEPSQSEVNDMFKKTKPIFKNNVGKGMIVWKNDHPYYYHDNNYKRETNLDPVKNYGMKSQVEIMSMDNPDRRIVKDKDAMIKAWNELLSKYGKEIENGFVIKSRITDDQLYFSNDLLKKFIQKDDDVHDAIGQIEEIIHNPDEVWQYIYGDRKKFIANTYIKFYKDKAVLVTANTSKKKNKATVVSSSYSAEYNPHKNDKKSQTLVKSRKGQLLWRKK